MNLNHGRKRRMHAARMQLVLPGDRRTARSAALLRREAATVQALDLCAFPILHVPFQCLPQLNRIC